MKENFFVKGFEFILLKILVLLDFFLICVCGFVIKIILIEIKICCYGNDVKIIM